MSWEIWITALALYGLFCLWYFNWKGPLTASEIDKYVTLAGSQLQGITEQDVRDFLENDDGREFIMQNMITMQAGQVAHPISGEMTDPRKLIQHYFKPLMKSMLKSAGHPVHQATRIGGRVEAWNCGEDQGFGAWAMVRYRSRRDAMKAWTNPDFAKIHHFKTASLAKTEAYPTRMQFSFFMRPHKSAALILILLASLAQNITLIQ